MSFSTKHCLICKSNFLPKTSHQKYCSNTCNSKACYHRNKLKYKLRRKLYRESHKEKIAIDSLKWQRKNKSKLKSYRSDPLKHLAANLRSRVSKAIRRNQFDCSAVNELGCSIEELKRHLESKFKPGMTWDNYGSWHVDHIKPLITATTELEIRKLCHYTNLQPLWAEENLSKGDSYELFN